MRITVTDRLVARSTPEGSATPFAVSVYDDSTEPWVLSTPTTLRYRVDDPEFDTTLTDWTTVTPASTATITVTGPENSISTGACRERRRLTVQVNNGLSTAAIATREWFVTDSLGIP